MKAIFFLLWAAPLATFGQGQIRFATYFLPQVDAPVFLRDVVGPGPGFSAQLFLFSEEALTPLSPSTTFRAASGENAIADRYVVPVDVTVPDHPPGSSVSVIMRVWPTSLGSYEQARFVGNAHGQTLPITVALGGGDLPPVILGALQGMILDPIMAFRNSLPSITAIRVESGRVEIKASILSWITSLQGSSNLVVWSHLGGPTSTVSVTNDFRALSTFTVDFNGGFQYYRLAEPGWPQ